MKHTLRRAKQRYGRRLNANRLNKILRSKDRIQLHYDRVSYKSVWAYKHAGRWYIVGKQGRMSKTLLPYTFGYHDLLERKLIMLDRVDEVFDYPFAEEEREAESAPPQPPSLYFRQLMTDMGLPQPPEKSQ